jgi:SnoaL-like domain
LDARDWDRLAKLAHADYVWEMPQSGERVRGLENDRAMNENYPGLPKIETRRITGSEDKWVLTPNWTVLKVTGSGDDYTAESLVKLSGWERLALGRHLPVSRGQDPASDELLCSPVKAPEWRSAWVESESRLGRCWRSLLRPES